MKTSELFKKEIEYIQNETVRKIVIETLDRSPECIQIIPSSSSGKYHPEYAIVKGKINDDGSVIEGGLARHVKAAVGIAHCMIETDIFSNMVLGIDAKENMNYYEDKEMYADATYAALILHDCCKPDDTLKHSTRFDHPLVAANLLKNVSREHISLENMEYMKKIIPMIHGAIASHMGQFNTAPYAKGIVLPKPKTGLEQFVHMCDYLASRKFLTFEFGKYDYNSRG